mgnify:FL=1
MNTKEFIDKVCKEIKYKPANKQIADELETHIEELKNDNLCKGLSEDESEEIAVKQMGDAQKIGKSLNKIHRPKLDWITFIISLVFICFGGQIWSLFDLKSYWTTNYSTDWNIYYKFVCIELVLGVIFSIFIFFYDYRKIKKYSKAIFILATILNIIAYIKGFRANGNLVYGLWPVTSTSPSVFIVPLYILAFVGFIQNANKENVSKIIVLSCIAIISSLIINFSSGFIVTMVYLIISSRELFKRRETKKALKLILLTIVGFGILSTLICIIPTRARNKIDPYTSANWVGVDTVGERRVDFVRKKIFENAKWFGKADLESISISDELGYNSSIQNMFGINSKFAFLGILEEYGWAASLGLLLIVLAFDVKLILSARKITDSNGRLIAVGIASLFAVQTLCNLAMNFGIIGTAEFQLPLISGGKATTISNILCIALFLAVYRRKDINFEEPKEIALIFKKRYDKIKA